MSNIDASAVDPERLIAAMTAAGIPELSRRTGLYARMDWPTGLLLVPLDRSKADYADLLGDALGGLEHAVEVGAKARRVLDALEGDGR